MANYIEIFKRFLKTVIMKMTSIFFNRKKRFMTRKTRNTEFKKRKKKRNTVDLPDDLLVGILSRVPATSLARLRLVSKGWNALIKDGKFVKKSLVIMLIEFRVYIVSVDLHNNVAPSIKVTSQISLKDPLSNSSEEVDIHEVLHCDGLLLCSTEDKRLVVWNPCSCEIKWIKPRKKYKKFDLYALGKSSCNKYKILRVDHFGYFYPCFLECEVYDFTSNSWRRVGETRDWFIPRFSGRGMTVNGNTYWLACTQDSAKEDFLLCFDFSTERFGNVSLPGDHLSYHVFALSVTREDQQLCMIATRNRHVFDFDVWMATKIESTGAASWSKLLSVMEQACRPLPFCFCIGMNFLADQENKVIVCRGKHGVSNDFLNIMGEDKCIKVDHHDVGSKCSLLVSYIPNLVQIQ